MLDVLDLETFTSLPVSFSNLLDIHLQTEQSSLLPQGHSVLETPVVATSRDEESSSVFYQPEPSPKLKLEMEVFGDLDLFCQPFKAMNAKLFQSTADELNTPIFEKAHFDYDRPLNSDDLLDVATSAEDSSNPKIKNIDTVNIESNSAIKEDNIILKEEDGENKDISSMMPIGVTTDVGKPVNYVVISSPGISTNSSNVFTLNNTEYEDIYASDKVTPIKVIGDDDEYLPTVNNCSDIFFNGNTNYTNKSFTQGDDSTNQYIIIQTAPFETPDSSRSASDFSDNSNPKLTLDIDKKFKSINDIETPDVIETIDAIENDRAFNILNFISDEDINAAGPVLSSLNVPTTTTTTSPSTSLHLFKADNLDIQSVKRTVKRKYKKDDDEDYKPPSSKRRKHISKTTDVRDELELYDSDSDSEGSRVVRRGRPPVRNVSVSSEDSTIGKYRVMRDKNNEASRKSRLKRKLKEQAQEKEAEELEERNLKLKTQVAELERTVTNFRSNLMQILLKK